MRRIRWAPVAVDDLERIRNYQLIFRDAEKQTAYQNPVIKIFIKQGFHVISRVTLLNGHSLSAGQSRSEPCRPSIPQ